MNRTKADIYKGVLSDASAKFDSAEKVINSKLDDISSVFCCALGQLFDFFKNLTSKFSLKLTIYSILNKIYYIFKKLTLKIKTLSFFE